MDSFGNLGFRGTQKQFTSLSSLQSNLIKANRLKVSGTSNLNNVEVNGDLTVDGDTTLDGTTVLNSATTVNGNFYTTGSINQIGNANGDTVGFYGVTPVARQSTSVASATFSAVGGGSSMDTNDTFDGYTLPQVVKALRNIGLLQ
jgi:hypothetical protein